MTPYKKGKIIKVTVTGIEQYGAFVSADESYSGLIHISEISSGYVRNIKNYLGIGDIVEAEIIDVDEIHHQLKLSIKNINYNNKSNIKKKKIKETNLGFKTLAYKLPFWIEESLKKQKNL